MPKVKIKFTLPEENDEYKIAYNASSMYNVLFDYLQTLHNHLKYAEDDLDKETLVTLQDELHAMLREEGVEQLFE